MAHKDFPGSGDNGDGVTPPNGQQGVPGEGQNKPGQFGQQGPGQGQPGQQGQGFPGQQNGRPGQPGQPQQGQPQGGWSQYGQPGQNARPGQPGAGQGQQPGQFGQPNGRPGQGQPGQGQPQQGQGFPGQQNGQFGQGRPGQPGQPGHGQPGQGFPGQQNGRPGQPGQAGAFGAGQQGRPGQPGQPQNGQFGQGRPGQSGAFGATGMNGQQGGKKKTGLWIGIGAGVLALILLLIFIPMAIKGGKGGGSAASGPEGEAENAVNDYINALKDGKAQDAISKMDTSSMSGFDKAAPQYSDKVYSQAKNRPQSFEKSSVDKISDDYVKVTGKVKQKNKDLDAEYTVRKIGGEWKVSPKSAYMTAPSIDGSPEGFPLIMNGATLKSSSSSSASDLLPGDYEFSSVSNEYFTSNKVTKTVWVDGTDEGNSQTSDITVKSTEKARAKVQSTIEGMLKKCAADKDTKTCGSGKFNAYSTEGKLTDLKVSIGKMPQMSFKNDSTPNRYSVDTTKDGSIHYDAKLDGRPTSDDEDFSVVALVTLGADGSVKEAKIY